MGGVKRAVKKVGRAVRKVVKKTASVATGGLIGGSRSSGDDGSAAAAQAQAEAQRQTQLAQQSANMTRKNDPDASGLVMEDGDLGMTSLTGPDGLPVEKKKLQPKNKLGGE
jgi:hypothetical protein